jgi:UPF0755 protein
MRRVLIALVVLIVLAGLGIGGAYVWIEGEAQRPVDPQAIELVDFEIPKGASLDKIGVLLADRGLISSAAVWKAYVRLHPTVPAKAGKFRLSPAMPITAILTTIGGRPLSDDLTLTIVEGWRIRDVDEYLAAQGLAPAGAYLAAAQDPKKFQISFPVEGKDLEGYLYPETYRVKRPFDVNQLVQRQLDKFYEVFAKPNADEIAKSGRTLHQLVTMASLLEREEPKPPVRSKVAGVLYKRLDSKTPLGVDATSRYLLADWSDRKAFLARLRDPADPYNTRLNPGLPPGPIGAPAIESLVAALRPEKSDYWYYLHDKDRNIHFAADAAGHEANRKKYNVY